MTTWNDNASSPSRFPDGIYPSPTDAGVAYVAYSGFNSTPVPPNDVKVDGIYDRTQMADVYRQWQEVPSNRWKDGALQEIVAGAHLVGKNSTPYTPTSKHDFMHDKVLVVDDTVITGSYNFSRSAEFNAENILFIESGPLAETYSAHIDRLIQKYR